MGRGKGVVQELPKVESGVDRVAPLRESSIVRRALVVSLLTTLWLLPLLTVNAWVGAKTPARTGSTASTKATQQSANPPWAASTTQTTATFAFTAPSAED